MLTIDSTALVLLTALISAGSALIGVVITSYFNLRTIRLTKESEERKHQRELVISAAVEDWKQQLEIAKVAPKPAIIRPLDDYIIKMIAVSDLLLDKPINKAVINERLQELEDFYGAVDSFRKLKNPLLK